MIMQWLIDIQTRPYTHFNSTFFLYTEAERKKRFPFKKMCIHQKHFVVSSDDVALKFSSIPPKYILETVLISEDFSLFWHWFGVSGESYLSNGQSNMIYLFRLTKYAQTIFSFELVDTILHFDWDTLWLSRTLMVLENWLLAIDMLDRDEILSFFHNGFSRIPLHPFSPSYSRSLKKGFVPSIIF
jgi:hypothetical protein